MLLAEHPDDESRRVLVRGKGNLSTSPPAIEFEIEGARFEHHGHTFSVPRAVNFAESLLDIDDLISAPAQPPPAGEARTAAREIIADALADGEWHEAAPIIAACAKREVHERATRRAAKDVGIEQEKRGFPAASWWRLQSGQANTSVGTGRSVRSVQSEDSALDGSPDRRDSSNSRADRQDRQDRQHTTNGAVRTDPDAELERIVSKFGSGDS